MPRTKHDRDLVASNEPYEPRDIAQKFNTTKETVLQVMLELGKNGKYCRSRKMIYKRLREVLTEPTDKPEVYSLTYNHTTITRYDENQNA